MTDEATPNTKIDTTNIAEIFHTALRKSVDGNASVASWNMLNFLPDKVRISFYEHLSKQLSGVDFDAGALRTAALSWSNEYDGRKYKHEAHAFGAVLELHPVEDWTAIAQFVRSCGAAPEASWESDCLSLWVNGNGFSPLLVVEDADGLEIGRAEFRPGMARGGEIRNFWMGSVGGLSRFDVPGDIDSAGSIVLRMKDEIQAARVARLEEKVRPEFVSALENIDLAPMIDVDDNTDYRFTLLAGEGARILFRRPRWDNGRQSVEFVFAVRDMDLPTGYRFGSATVFPDIPEKDKTYPSSIQRWLEGSQDVGTKRIVMGTDEDLVRGTIHLSHEGETLTVRSVLTKVGADERVLSERTTEISHVRRLGSEAIAVPSPG